MSKNVRDTSALLEKIHEFLLPTILQSAQSRPEDYSRILFEDDGKDCASRFKFLKDLSLSQVVYGNVDDASWFTIGRRNYSEDNISVSNRLPTKGELRGIVLRKMLEAATELDPYQSVYEAIRAYVASPHESRLEYIKGVALKPVEQTGWGLTEKQYALLVRMLCESCQFKLSQGYTGKEDNFWDADDVAAMLHSMLEIDRNADREDDLRVALRRHEVATFIRESEVRCKKSPLWIEQPHLQAASEVFKAIKAEYKNASLEKLTYLAEIHEETRKALNNPRDFDAVRYEKLRQHVLGHRSWGKVLAGVMLMFLGAISAAVPIIGELLMTAGAGMAWYHGCQHGAAKHMSLFAKKVEKQQQQPATLSQIEASLAR